MKISKREKFLFVVLALVIICAGYYKLVYVNQAAKLNTLKEEEKSLQKEYTTMSNNIATIAQNKGDIKSLNYGIESKSTLLYPKIYQDRIILEVNKLLKDAGIKGNLTFSEIAVASVEPYFSAPKEEKLQGTLDEVVKAAEKDNKGTSDEQAVQGSETTKTSDSTGATSEQKFVEQMKVSVSFSGTYSNVTKFIKMMSEYDRLVAMPNITITASGKEEVSGTLDLEFYSIPKLNKEEDSKYLKWPYADKEGKENPFLAGSTAASNKTRENGYELVMSLKSTNSDLPSITLGRESDKAKGTYVYNDENQKVEIEIQVNEVGSKYYIKYKTPKSSYPSNYSENGIELKNIEGDITVGVYSSIRTDINDKVGANIKVKNSTEKKVSITIVDDDKASPRVQITSEGKVEYVNK